MSELYKSKQNFIIKNYKYLGIKERLSFYAYRFLMIICSFMLCGYLSQMIKSESNKEGGLPVLIFVIAILSFYYLSKHDNKKHQENKMNAVSNFVKEPDINIEIVDALIGEIERSIKKKKTFATWITGLSATFIILLATLITNYFVEIFDLFLKVTPADELSSMFENLNLRMSMDDIILNLLIIGFVLLIIFIILIFIIYILFSMFTFVQEQILIFLFDVRYEILSNATTCSKFKTNYDS